MMGRHIQRGENDILLRVDKQTAQEIKRMSEEMQSSIREVTRWITWLARKSLGRKIKIEEQGRTLEISLEDFAKLVDLESIDGSKAPKAE